MKCDLVVCFNSVQYIGKPVSHCGTTGTIYRFNSEKDYYQNDMNFRIQKNSDGVFTIFSQSGHELATQVINRDFSNIDVNETTFPFMTTNGSGDFFNLSPKFQSLSSIDETNNMFDIVITSMYSSNGALINHSMFDVGTVFFKDDKIYRTKHHEYKFIYHRYQNSNNNRWSIWNKKMNRVIAIQNKITYLDSAYDITDGNCPFGQYGHHNQSTVRVIIAAPIQIPKTRLLIMNEPSSSEPNNISDTFQDKSILDTNSTSLFEVNWKNKTIRLVK